MAEYTINRAKKYIKKYIKENVSVLLLGAPGVGKTYGVFEVGEEMAQELGLKGISIDTVKPDYYNILDFRAGQREYSDIKGLPYPNKNCVEWLMPKEFEQIKEGTYGTIFFDEITQANPEVQNALFQLIHDKRLGNFVLPKTWSIVAAGNRTEDKSNVTPLGMALNNRFQHLTITTNLDAFTNWGLKNGIKLEVIGFLKFKPDYLHKLENHKFPAYPTPRSWHRASDLLDGLNLEKKEDIEEAYEIMCQTIGDGVAMEWKAYQELTRKIDVDDILNNPTKAKQLIEISEKYSLVTAVVNRYKNNKERKKELELTNKVCKLCFELEDEFATFLMKLLVETQPKFADNLAKSEYRKEMTEKYLKYFNFD